MDLGAPEDARGLDLSGLFYDETDEVLWLVSDEARAVFVLDRTGRPLAAFDAGQSDLEGHRDHPLKKSHLPGQRRTAYHVCIRIPGSAGPAAGRAVIRIRQVAQTTSVTAKSTFHVFNTHLRF
jgi:hypothetical protein